MEQNNILAFPAINRTRKASDGSDAAKPGTSAKVHTLLTNPRFQVYEERFGQKRELLEPFFSILMSSGNVTITEKGKNILDAILRVVSKTFWTYEITVGDFLNVTEPVMGMTGENNAMWYVTSNLDDLGIAMAYTTDGEENFTESVMDEEGLRTFRPEEMRIIWDLWLGEDGFYGILLNVTKDTGLFYSPDEFSEPENIPLLHLLSFLRYEVLYHGIDPKGGLSLELSKYERNDTFTTHIPLAYLDMIIDAAILRKYPIYANYLSMDKRMDRFHTDMVSPFLNPETVDGDE